MLDDLGERCAAPTVFATGLVPYSASRPGFPANIPWLPQETSDAVREVRWFARYRSGVARILGLAAKSLYGRAVSAILAGPPGTGKTMVMKASRNQVGSSATISTVIDLSQVVNNGIEYENQEEPRAIFGSFFVIASRKRGALSMSADLPLFCQTH